MRFEIKSDTAYIDPYKKQITIIELISISLKTYKINLNMIIKISLNIYLIHSEKRTNWMHRVGKMNKHFSANVWDTMYENELVHITKDFTKNTTSLNRWSLMLYTYVL